MGTVVGENNFSCFPFFIVLIVLMLSRFAYRMLTNNKTINPRCLYLLFIFEFWENNCVT